MLCFLVTIIILFFFEKNNDYLKGRFQIKISITLRCGELNIRLRKTQFKISATLLEMYCSSARVSTLKSNVWGLGPIGPFYDCGNSIQLSNVNVHDLGEAECQRETLNCINANYLNVGSRWEKTGCPQKFLTHGTCNTSSVPVLQLHMTLSVLLILFIGQGIPAS